MLSVRRHILVLFTMLALLGQGMLTNGHWMVPTAEAHSGEMHSTAHPMAATMDCHPQQTQSSHCCDDPQVDTVLPDTVSHCCEGKGFCKSDCNHCLVISVAGTLIAIGSWPVMSLPEAAVATPMPHFHSVSVGQTIKPPIV